MKNTIVYSILGLALLALSCKKDEAGTVTATINIIEPSSTDTVTFGEELHLEGNITADGDMRGYTLTMTNTKNATNLLSFAQENHASAYSFHEHWVNNLTDTTIVKCTVEVEVNHDGTKVSKDVSVLCLPN